VREEAGVTAASAVRGVVLEVEPFVDHPVTVVVGTVAHFGHRDARFDRTIRCDIGRRIGAHDVATGFEADVRGVRPAVERVDVVRITDIGCALARAVRSRIGLRAIDEFAVSRVIVRIASRERDEREERQRGERASAHRMQDTALRIIRAQGVGVCLRRGFV
jgi:hypothetical protein